MKMRLMDDKWFGMDWIHNEFYKKCTLDSNENGFRYNKDFCGFQISVDSRYLWKGMG